MVFKHALDIFSKTNSTFSPVFAEVSKYSQFNLLAKSCASDLSTSRLKSILFPNNNIGMLFLTVFLMELIHPGIFNND